MESNKADSSGGQCMTTGAGIATLLGGIGLGAALMYIFDPQSGRRRRALLGDQVTSKANRLGDAAGSKARDLRNRAQGLVAEAGSMFRSRGAETGNGREGRNITSAEKGPDTFVSPTAIQGP